jgi:drug/metabolite transporter (DMT)-like permease
MLAQLGPLTLAGNLYLGAAVAVLPCSFRGGSAERRRHSSHIRRLAGSVVFGGIAGPVLMLWGLKLTPAASASLWLNFETAATALIACIAFREHLGARGLAAVASIIAAGVLLAFPFDTGTVAGACLIAAACVCWALDNNFTALIDGYTPAQCTLIKGAVAGTINLGFGLALEGSPTLSMVLAALAMGGLSYGVSIVLYIAGAQQLGATRSQMLFATAPAWGVALAWIGLGEPIGMVQIAAILPMTCGIALLLSASHEHEHMHEAMTHSHSHRHDDDHHLHSHPGLPAWIRHTHEHSHAPVAHAHRHHPDLHHRHEHG